MKGETVWGKGGSTVKKTCDCGRGMRCQSIVRNVAIFRCDPCGKTARVKLTNVPQTTA